MDVALYRGRGAEIVLVHASMRPPRSAQENHGPLRYLDTVRIDGSDLADAWPAFAEQIEYHAFAVLDERDALRLLRHRPEHAPEQGMPAGEST